MGKCLSPRGGEGIFRKKLKCRKFNPKTDLYTKFYPHRKMEKCSKPGEKVREQGQNSEAGRISIEQYKRHK